MVSWNGDLVISGDEQKRHVLFQEGVGKRLAHTITQGKE